MFLFSKCGGKMYFPLRTETSNPTGNIPTKQVFDILPKHPVSSFLPFCFFFSSFIDRKQQNKDFTWYWNQHISKFDFEVLFYLKKEEKCWAIDTEITWWSWRGSNNNEEMKRWPKIWDNPQSIWKNCSSFVIERRKEWRTSVTMSTRSDDDSLRHHWYSNSKSTCRLICLYHRKKIQPRRFQSFLYGHDQQSSNPRCNIISMDSTAQNTMSFLGGRNHLCVASSFVFFSFLSSLLYLVL